MVVGGGDVVAFEWCCAMRDRHDFEIDDLKFLAMISACMIGAGLWAAGVGWLIGNIYLTIREVF